MTKQGARTVHVDIRGRVQGVYYRGWTINTATGLGLNGWVRNRRDGSVEAVFSGERESIDEMLQRLWDGPAHAAVSAVDVREEPGPEPPAGFHEKPTL